MPDVGYQLRRARPDEFDMVTELDGAAFGFHYSDEDRQDARLDVELDRMLVAVDGDRIVGTSCELGLDMTLPGRTSLAVTGLTWVSVELTHRRQGILRSLMEQQIGDARDQAVPAIILTASEGGIYGRYGFGNASDVRKTIVDRRAARLLRPVAEPGVTRMTTDEARNVLPGIFDRWQRQQPGAVARDEARWQLMLGDKEHQRHGMSGLFHLVHADGYVSYRVKINWNDGHPDNECWLVDYVIGTPEAHAGLWQTLLGLDLAATIQSYRIPLDDPLPLLLADPRRVRTGELNDGLWVRPVDVPGLLGARRYAVELDVVLGVRDPLLGDACYRLDGGPNGATCTRTDATPDIELGVDDVGALSLGGRRVAPLVWSGRARCSDAALGTRLDRAFLADVAPQYGTAF
jgi:predicted acetyltransferase